jgi:amino-acid N-acetyltransferase
MSVHCRSARDEDRFSLDTILKNSKLASLDESSQFGDHYVVAFDENGELLGVAGVEQYGDVGLLRPVAGVEERRSQGIGKELASNRIEWASRAGVREVYLLTNDAVDYWQNHGFQRIDRSEAPTSMKATTEWMGACPSSAVAMLRRLPHA